MAICGRCSATYSGFTCPNCVQTRAIEKQTKAQAKFHKQQMKAMQGPGGGVSGGIVSGFIALMYHMTVLSWKFATFLFVFTFNMIKPFYEKNPHAFKKWAKIIIGTGVAIFVGLALLGGYLNDWK